MISTRNLGTCGLVAGALCTMLISVALGGETKIIFTDMSKDAGVTLPDTLTESLAWGDYDNDGDEDLYLTSNGPNNLFRNDGNGIFTDVTDEAGVGNDLFSVGSAFGDLDNDGDLDLYVVNFMTGLDALYRNDGPVGPGGAYVFTDIAKDAGITLDRSSRGIVFLDYNQDSLLDIYVNAIGEDILYRNDGNLQFTDVAADQGFSNPGQGVGAVITDLDNNGWIDIFTGNRSGDLNRLYMNDGGVFTDVTESAGINRVGLGMGVHAFDYNNDLKIDLYWTVWPDDDGPQANALYENIDGTTFVDVGVASGTDDPDGWGISNNAGDIDNDGWEDFFVTNGFDETTSPNVLFHNQGDGTFTDITDAIGGAAWDGRGFAFADYDNDGDIDLLLTADVEAFTRMWRNDTITTNHWITLKLVGTQSNRSAIGARIEVTTDIQTVVKEVSGGAGRGSFNSLPVEFGLGAAEEITEIAIRWPNQLMQTVSFPAMDQILTIIEPCEGDANGDGTVDPLDAGFVLARFGCPVGTGDASCDAADQNGDGAVDPLDSGFVLARFGSCL